MAKASIKIINTKTKKPSGQHRSIDIPGGVANYRTSMSPRTIKKKVEDTYTAERLKKKGK